MNDGSNPTMAQLMDLLILRSGERSVTNSSANNMAGLSPDTDLEKQRS
jgi:hypothetical protein